ncbi:MAG: hypothetical protein RLZZ494_2059, partial [Pseudomonadota bacterium]
MQKRFLRNGLNIFLIDVSQALQG